MRHTRFSPKNGEESIECAVSYGGYEEWREEAGIGGLSARAVLAGLEAALSEEGSKLPHVLLAQTLHRSAQGAGKVTSTDVHQFDQVHLEQFPALFDQPLGLVSEEHFRWEIWERHLATILELHIAVQLPKALVPPVQGPAVIHDDNLHFVLNVCIGSTAPQCVGGDGYSDWAFFGPELHAKVRICWQYRQ